MKTNEKITRLAGLTVALTISAATVVTALAGETATGKGGASLLLKPGVSISAPSMPTMSCPACKSEYVTRKDATARGATKSTVIVERHLCKGCETTITTTGTGKAKQTLAVHRCLSGGSKELACCAGH
jgi:hypothetical protein